MIDFTDFQTKIDKESPVHGSFYLTVNRVSLGLRVVVWHKEDFTFMSERLGI